ncbi:MAG: glycosyltransferase, partial [Nocardioidaceae bacterium]
PLVAYLQGRRFDVSVHPLFDAAGYLRSHPTAASHPSGPLGHYTESGAAAGAAPNRWYRPRPDEPRGLVDWAAVSWRAWHERRADVTGEPPSVDWDRLAAEPRDETVVSVVVTTREDWRATRAAVASVLAADVPDGLTVECVVVDDGSGSLAAQVLDSLERIHDRVRVRHLGAPQGEARARDLALPLARGGVVVLLDHTATVDRGWLAPLVAPVAGSEVRATQSLLLNPSGSLRSAGTAFPGLGGLPYPFLADFPVEDTRGLDGLTFSALSGSALAIRTADLVAVRGSDPDLPLDLADADLCLRLAALGPGTLRVVPASRVTVAGSRRPGSAAGDAAGRRRFLDRWGETAPEDDAELWGSRGFEVVGREAATGPILARSRAHVAEGAPRLRWALKNPATPGSWGDAWGDTHFARNLATGLRALGQEVVVDRRDDYYRPSGYLDDVVLTLRGRTELVPQDPRPDGQVSLAWVISHPEMVSREEVASYDRVFAASRSWAARSSQDWSVRIEPLLQATDPDLFRPDRAEPDTGHEVLFVGGSRGEERQMVRDAIDAGLPLAVFGSQWEDFIPASLVRGEFVPNDELGALYAAAGVVLNDHWPDMRRDGFVSNRLFDAVACGARVVSDEVAGLEDLFGASVRVVHDAAELGALLGGGDLDAVFGSLEERRTVAERVRREHTFRQRARRLLDAALEVRGARE